MATDRIDLIFKPAVIESSLNNTGDVTLSQQRIRISVRSATMSVTSIYIELGTLANYIDTNANPNTPYEPLYPGDPTTKQYVDQHDTIVSATAPSNPTEGMVWYDSTNDVLKTYDGTNWSEAGTKMVVLEYGVSTWQDFLDAYNKNAIVYCKVSSGSSGYRMAFMAYTAGQGTPTEVEFQYYRSRSSHSQDSTQLDEVYVYKLTNAGTWTTTQRDTGARITNGTGISISSATSSGITTRTISADTSVLATKTYVDEHDTVVSSTAPSSPTEGMLWYDTTNDALKVYDGTNWNLVGKEYFPGVGIYFTDAIEYDKSAMRGPCPEGFHIPTDYESKQLVEMILGFGFTLEEMTFPKAGSLSNYNGAHGRAGSGFSYWTCESDFDRYSPWNETHAYKISDDGVHSSLDFKATGCSIRPFKDNPIIPDSDWYPVYQSEGGGVYYNGTLGLISFSSDGTNWITIADKNLGATQMYIDGDEYTADNCGGFFQRGNNYMFPYSGATKTSSTRVEASGYGPGNYYSSDTFIGGSGSAHNDRASDTGVETRDLRGYTTGAVSKVIGSTINSTVTESPNVKAFYLASDQDLTTAQSALNWIDAGKSAIIVYNDETYIDDSYTSTRSIKGDTKAASDGSRTFKTNRTYTEIINDHSIVYSDTLTIHYTGNPHVVDEIITSQFEETPKVLATDVQYPVVYTPLYDGSPATKKYVDDKSTYVGGSAPSNPTEGIVWYDTTNDVLKVYNGTNWIAVGVESNTKTFYLSSTSDLTNAQAAYDWYVAGKNPIIRISGWNYSFILEGNNSEPTYHLGFYGVEGGVYNGRSNSSIGINPRLELRRSSNTVTSVVVTSYNADTLFTNVDYSTPYNPQYPGSPATKKYVDDTAGGKVSDTAYGSSWDGVTGVAPSKNAVYDKISAMDTTISGKANDGDVVKLTGNQTIAGTKTFSTSPVVPSKTTAATNTGTAIATEAQVYKKQDTLVSGTNIKSINNQSLLGSGNITISAPTYTAGDNIQISAQNVISATDTTYEAGSGIGITNTSISSRQGPCAEGWHVPSRADMQGVSTIMTSLSLTSSTDWETKLHIPYAEFREEHASIETGDIAYLWTTTPSNNNVYAYRLEDGMSVSEYSEQRNYALSIRPFKNEYVAPDGTWTVVQGTLGNTGIFWNQTEGMITITNGTTGYTIADKNLGATTVYSHGDALSQANCGNFYQRGNNYGFAWSGSITSVNSTVDASGYGPGNYYSGSTFLYGSGGDWSSVQNNNLWGDVTNSVSVVNTISNTAPFNATSGGVKVFDLPSVSDDITDLVNWFTNGGSVVLKDSSSVYYTMCFVDTSLKEIVAYSWDGYSQTMKGYNIAYNSSKAVTTVSDISQNIYSFNPGGTATTGYVVTKTASGYEWQAPTEPTVISGDSGVTYTIKVSNSDPSGASNTTITLVP